MSKSRAENFRMVDIGINAWSSLFDNLKINIILQDYLKSVWKTVIIGETAAANQRKADNQWENRNILIGENDLRISKDREKKSGLGLKWKVSTVDIRIKKSGLKFIHSKVPSSVFSVLSVLPMNEEFRSDFDMFRLYQTTFWKNQE